MRPSHPTRRGWCSSPRPTACRRLWLRTFDGDGAEPLPGTEGASLPAWKRGGGVVAFFAGGRLKQIALADASVRDLAAAPVPGGAAWLADGSLLFAPAADGPLQHLRAGVRSEAAPLQPGDRAHLFPSSPDGSQYVYIAVREDGRRVVRLVRDGSRADLTATSGHAQLVGDLLLHVRDGILVAQTIDAETTVLTGRAAALATSAAVSPAGHASFAASAAPARRRPGRATGARNGMVRRQRRSARTGRRAWRPVAAPPVARRSSRGGDADRSAAAGRST